MVVDETGKVEKAIVEESSGDSRLDEAATAGIMNVRCIALDRAGQPIAARAVTQQRIAFKLDTQPKKM